MAEETAADPAAVYDRLLGEVSQVLIGKEKLVERLAVALFTRGNVLMEGVPGVAKTTVATLFSRATGLRTNRVQMTPDILPADITGTHVYQESTGEFTLQRGPVFANVVIADEINRATPKTQSALLEAMQERTVSIEGETLDLPTPFMVVATQNPIEMEGVFELPAAQRDRFQFKLDVSLPERPEESELLDRFDADPELGPESVNQVVDADELLACRRTCDAVHIADAVQEYVLDIVAATRESPDVVHGASPRASLALQRTAKAQAAIRGRDYVIPDDVKELAPDVLVHRLVRNTDAELADVDTRNIVANVLDAVEPPEIETDVELAAAED